MIISIYINKTIIYLFIYCIFKVLLYSSISNFFSSFLPPLYLISISKLFSFILYVFQYKINQKIQSIENNNNINQVRNRNEQQLINIPANLNIRDISIYQSRKKIINICLIICASMLEVLFYASFNKWYEKDLTGNKRVFYYLINNKLFFLFILVFIYLVFYKKYNNIHNKLSLFLIFFSQIILYIMNYKENVKHYKLLIYSFLMNIIYAFQNFIEKEISENNIGRNISSPMVIMGTEGIFELIVVIILHIFVNSYFGKNQITDSIINISITVKYIFMMCCILLSEYVRIGTLKQYNPFYICFFEEIIYIFFSIFNYPDMELYYVFFHIILVISFFIFIETIELNFCGLNHSTQRYLREINGDLNDILLRIANISSISTGSHSDSSKNNDSGLVINEDVFNFDINNNETKIIFGKMENSDDLKEDDKSKNIKEDKDKDNNINNINIGEILDEEKDSFDYEEKNVFSNHLLK